MDVIKRWIRFIIGLSVASLGMVMTIKANLGVAPWDVFHIGLTEHFNLTIGRAGQLTGIVIILISFMVAKIRPTIGTIINIWFVGVMIDWIMLLISEPISLLFRYTYLILGIIIFGTGVGIYISAQCGTGPRDSLMMALNEKIELNIAFVRNGIELIALITGYFLGGPVGIGTLLIALGIGPVVGNSLKMMNRLFDDFSLQRNG